jgi:SAM-dependent methyltransferase
MCDPACIEFGKNLPAKAVKGARVLEVGSLDVNGSVRADVMALNPSLYIGCDIMFGKGVDIKCEVENLVSLFGYETFDIVISTEMLEHVKDWRAAIHNIKAVTRKGGYILITTRSIGFAKHCHPYDFWRFEDEDMRKIFSDCDILRIEKDIYAPGIFILAQKPKDFHECFLDDISIYHIEDKKYVK